MALVFGLKVIDNVMVVEFTPDEEKRLLHVKFNDGQTAFYPYVWLRDNAPDPETMEYTEKCKSRILVMNKLDLKVSPHKLEMTSKGIQVQWNTGCSPVTYSSEWLKARNVNSPNIHKWRWQAFHLQETKSLSAADKAEISSEKADWNEMTNEFESLYLMEQLQKFLKYGLLFVENVPKQTGQLKKFGDLLGFMTNSHYGPILTIKAERKPSSVAYTSNELNLHTDLNQCECSPDIQALHCISQSGRGGQNQFCDGFKVAEQLKVEKPEIYQILTQTPIEFVDDGMVQFPYIMAAWHPTICTNTDGRLKAIHFNNHMRSWYLEVPPEKVELVYEALKTFNDYCYQERNLFETKLKPGIFIAVVIGVNWCQNFRRNGYVCK